MCYNLLNVYLDLKKFLRKETTKHWLATKQASFFHFHSEHRRTILAPILIGLFLN